MSEAGTKMPESGYKVCDGCGGSYMLRDMHERGARHQEWQKLGQMEIGVPEQPQPRTFTELPARLSFGDAAICPRCKGRIKKSYMKDRIKHDLSENEWYAADPEKPSTPCKRCGGKGLVPNVSA